MLSVETHIGHIGIFDVFIFHPQILQKKRQEKFFLMF